MATTHGERREKGEYRLGTYQYAVKNDIFGIWDDWVDNHLYNYIDIGDDIAGTQYDVAHVKWGKGWQMPSIEQIEELLDYTQYDDIKLNDVEGKKCIGQNGNAIFFPKARCYYYGGLTGQYCYWSSTSGDENGAYTLSFDLIQGWVRENGLTVRPVSK